MDLSRYEVNQLVRAVLTRHSVDLTLVDSSFIGGTVYVSGSLQKSYGEEFAPGSIDELTKDITRVSGVRDVQFDLDNWIMNSAHGSWQSLKGENRPLHVQFTSPQAQDAASTGATVEIKSGEQIAEVLEDLKKKEADRNEKHENVTS